jgi:hypothetical protein
MTPFDDAGGWYPSTTYRYETPEGSVYITAARGRDGAWIDCTAGKSGTGVRADAHALAAVCGISLRHGTPPIKLVHALKEVSHEGSGGMRLAKRSGAAVALSIADALGDALWQELV